MMFSVVVPLYNKAPFIAATLRSLFEQTFEDFEVIVIDDGSSDSGAQIVQRMSERRLRYVRQENAGVSAARNHGIAIARGQWVAFLDADDQLHPSYLARQHQAIRDHPGSDFVATGFRTIPAADWAATIDSWPLPTGGDGGDGGGSDDSGGEIYCGGDVEIINDLPSRWMKSTTFMTSCVAIRRRLLDELAPCFAVGESAGEDLDLFFRAAERTAIVFSPAPLLAYRAAGAQSLSSLAGPGEEPPFLSRLEQRARSAAAPGSGRSVIRFVQEIRISQARNLLAAGRRLEAIQLLWLARAAATRHRWWTTAAMSLLLPATLAHTVHQRRLKRGQHP